MSNTKLVVGLGNPGDKYRLSRHNVGFMVLDTLCERWQEKFKSLYCEVADGGEKIIYLKPQAMMNNSGVAIADFKNFFKVDNADITIIHDEVDLPFGEVRLKEGGGSAGHKGIQSTIDAIGDDFRRIRIGIRQPIVDLVETRDFVLAEFSKAEQEKLPEIIESAAKLINS